MWVKVRQVIRDKRTAVVVLGVVAIGCMMFTYQKGYDQGQDTAYGRWAAWEEGCQEQDLDDVVRLVQRRRTHWRSPASSTGCNRPVTYRRHPNFGSAADNPAR